MAHHDGDVLNLNVLCCDLCSLATLLKGKCTSNFHPPKVFDVKFPIAVIPYESMTETTVPRFQRRSLKREPLEVFSWPLPSLCMAQVRRNVHRLLARIVGWSLAFTAEGKFPETGFVGERFHPNSLRFTLRGKQMADGWRRGKRKG